MQYAGDANEFASPVGAAGAARGRGAAAVHRIALPGARPAASERRKQPRGRSDAFVRRPASLLLPTAAPESLQCEFATPISTLNQGLGSCVASGAHFPRIASHLRLACCVAKNRTAKIPMVRRVIRGLAPEARQPGRRLVTEGIGDRARRRRARRRREDPLATPGG